MKTPHALAVLLGLTVISILISSCASIIVEEIDGPVVELDITDNTQLVTVSGRKGVTQQFLAIRPYVPEQIRGSVVLFAGGRGYLGLDEYGSFRSLGGNFLVRNRNYFVQQGMIVALVDAPSGRRSLDRFRTTWAHAVDIRAVIDWLRKTAEVPVWLVGTSRGTISAAGVAGQLPTGGPDGIVLTSSVFGPSNRGSVYDADLAAIKVPVLLVHHQNDLCSCCPYWGASAFMRHVSSASKAELITIEGGATIGDPCGGGVTWV